MKKRLLLLLSPWLVSSVFAGQSSTQTNTYLSVLPPEQITLEILNTLPDTQNAQAGITFSTAERTRLENGPYEWSVGGESARRRVSGDGRYNEYAVTIERPVRWFGKAQKDAELGEKTLQISVAGFEDALHESARTLLAEWFNYLRVYHASLRINQQVTLYERLMDDIQKRFQKGDIPKLEVLLAETEYKRLQVAQQQAAQAVTLQRIKLDTMYAGLPTTLPYTALPPLPPRIDNPQHWMTQLLEDNHAINGARLSTAKAKLQAERSTLEKTPDPTLSVRYSSERSNEERVLGVAISIPLPGENRRADQTASAAQLTMAYEKERQVRTLAEQEASSLIAQFNHQQAIASTQILVAKEASDTTVLIKKAYMLGETAFSDTLLASRQSLEAQQAAEEAHLNTLELYARILLDTHQIWSRSTIDSSAPLPAVTYSNP